MFPACVEVMVYKSFLRFLTKTVFSCSQYYTVLPMTNMTSLCNLPSNNVATP